MVHSFFVAATILSATLASPIAQNDVIHIDVVPRKSIVEPSSLTTVEQFLVDVNATLAKYHVNHLLPPLRSLSKRKVSSEPVFHNEKAAAHQAAWYGNIQVNSQTFTVGFDSGSVNLWVPGQGCHGCAPGTRYYNEKGTPLHKNVSLNYGNGIVNGTEWKDRVTVAGLSVDNATLIAVDSVTGFHVGPPVGLLGLGSNLATATHHSTIIENLIATNQLSKPEFSFFFDRNATETLGKSRLTLGGADPNLYTGSFTKVPVTKKDNWEIEVDAVYVNGTSVGSVSKAVAAVDTGTNVMYARPSVISALAKKIPGAKVVVPKPVTGVYLALPCNTKATVAFGFVGKQFALNPLDLILKQEKGSVQELIELTGAPKDDTIDNSEEDYCISSIVGADLPIRSDIHYIIGDAFLKSWYSTFSYAGNGSMNFALAKSF